MNSQPRPIGRAELLIISAPALALLPLSYWVSFPLEQSSAVVADASLRVILPAITVWYLWRRGLHLAQIGLSLRLTTTRFISSIGIALLILASGAILQNALVVFGFLSETGPEYAPLSPEIGAIVNVYLVTAASVSEELLYRGLLGAALLNHQRPLLWSVAFVCISAMLWTLGHGGAGIADIVGLLYTGILLAAFYVLIRTIWPLVVAHLIYNFLAYSQVS